MDVLILGTLFLDTLIQPGKHWQTGDEQVRLGVKDDAWSPESLTDNGSPHLAALFSDPLDSIAPRKFATFLADDNTHRTAPVTYTSVEHIMELLLNDVWVPELAKQLVKPYKVVGQQLPKWRLRFRWTLPDLPYVDREIVYKFTQVNTVVGRLVVD